MTKEATKDKTNTGVADQVERVVILPPYVALEHRQLVTDAENMLDKYSKTLISRFERELKKYPSAECHQEYIKRSERLYHEDPVRQLLLKQLSNIRMLCEKPRFMTKTI